MYISPKLFRIAAGLMLLCAPGWCVAQWSAAEDASYVTAFNNYYPPLDDPLATVPDYNTYAPLSRFLGSTLNDYILQMKNSVYPSYGFQPWLEGFNIAYRVTREIRYFRGNLKLVRELIAYRDDKRNVPLRTGNVVPGWGSSAYSGGNGRECYVVDSGQLLYPMFDMLRIAQENPSLLAEFNQAPNEFTTMLNELVVALEYHDFEYRDGPGSDEGHYVFTPRNYNEFYNYNLQYTPQPGNWYAAMGRALWTAWKVTGNTTYRDRALSIGRYMKRRIKTGTDGAFYWEYYLPVNPVSATPVTRNSVNTEDISHGGLTMSFPLMLAREGEVFAGDDLLKFIKTAKLGFARLGSGIMISTLNGNPNVPPSPGHAIALWVRLGTRDRELFSMLSRFFLRYWASPGPMDNAVLLEGQQSLSNSANDWQMYP